MSDAKFSALKNIGARVAKSSGVRVAQSSGVRVAVGAKFLALKCAAHLHNFFVRTRVAVESYPSGFVCPFTQTNPVGNFGKLIKREILPRRKAARNDVGMEIKKARIKI